MKITKQQSNEEEFMNKKFQQRSIEFLFCLLHTNKTKPTQTTKKLISKKINENEN